jgi:hypothetical protein
MVSYALLSAIPSLLSLVFFLGGVIVLATRRQQIGRRPANLAITGLVLLLANSVLVFALPAFIFRITTFEGRTDFPMVFGGIGLVTGLLHLSGILLLLLAVLADRQPVAPAWPAWPAAPVQRPPDPSAES